MRGRGPLDGLLVLAVAGLLLACGPDLPGPTGTPEPTGAASLAPPSEPTAEPTTPPASAMVSVRPDPTLLDLLPAAIDDVERTNDEVTGAEIAAELAGDAAMAADIEALAVALYAGPQDYAVVTVTRLRPGRFDEAYFRDWRDTFDAAVCDQAGGVDGRAEAPIAGRTAYIGTCVGGVRTYHVHLASPERLVSLQALGPGRYGERILAGLTE